MRAVTMRNAGRTYAQIAEALTNAGTPVTPEVVRADIRKAYKEIIGEARDDMIARQRSVLFDFQRANYLDAINTDPEKTDERVAAQKLILSAMDHEAKLFGLYSPQRVSLGISDTEFAEETARLISELGLEPPKELTSTLTNKERREALDVEIAVDAETAEQQQEAVQKAELEHAEAVASPTEPGWSNI